MCNIGCISISTWDGLCISGEDIFIGLEWVWWMRWNDGLIMEYHILHRHFTSYVFPHKICPDIIAVIKISNVNCLLETWHVFYRRSRDFHGWISFDACLFYERLVFKSDSIGMIFHRAYFYITKLKLLPYSSFVSNCTLIVSVLFNAVD